MKKFKILMLVLFMFLTNILTFADYDGTIRIPDFDNETWESFFASYGLPTTQARSILVDGQTLPLNIQLLEDKGIVVYGDWYLVKARNDFKADTQNESGVGYYRENNDPGGRLGEYRYHGHSENGGLVGNNDFPRDASSATPLEEKEWVITPWKDGSFAKASFDRHVGTINNLNALATRYMNKSDSEIISELGVEEFEKLNKTKEIAKEGLDFDIKWGTFDGVDIQTITDPIYYANFEAVPTTRLSGQSILFHQSKWDQQAWYQTFPVKRTGDKIDTPLETTIDAYKIYDIDETGAMTLFVKVVAHLKDDDFYIPYHQISSEQELLDNTTRYHRDDIQSWQIEFSTPTSVSRVEKHGSAIEFNEGNKAYQWFKVYLTYSDYEAMMLDETSMDLTAYGQAWSYFSQDQTLFSYDDTSEIMTIDGGIIDTIMPEVDLQVKFEVNATHEILDVWSFPLSLTEINVPEDYVRRVTLEGKILSSSEESSFLNGTYHFPVMRENKIYNYKISYSNGEKEFFYSSWVLVYDSLPHAAVEVTDYGKVNRKNTVTVDTSITPDFVEANTSISISNFSISARKGQTIYYDLNTSTEKDYMIKDIDTVDVDVSVTNEYGTRSYKHEIYSGEDYIPDLISIIWNNNLARQEGLDVFSEGASLDGDTVGAVSYEIFYDADQDGIAEQSLQALEEFTGSIDYVPTRLGFYEIEFTVTEAFGQPTIEAYIKPEDYQSNTVRREFFVSNLVPMTKVYSDIDFNYPEVDMTFLVDEDYPRSEMDYIRANDVNIRNNFRLNDIVANLQTWDLYTYIYSQSANTRYHSGSSYPPSTRPYDLDGYSGTLNRYDVDNYRYSRDEGYYVTQTDSKTATDTRSTSGIGTSSSTPPSSVYYSKDGYTGTLYEDSYTYSAVNIFDEDGNYVTFEWTRTKTYSGTVTKTIQVWVSDIVWYNNYYGDYSGTVYKSVKQSFTPTYEQNTNKYIVYFASDQISNIEDLEKIKTIAPDHILILVSDQAIGGMINEDFHIDYTNDTSSIIQEIVSIVKSDNPFSNARAVLVNETFALETSDIDVESDPIIEEGLQYIHDPSYFDNSMGMALGTYPFYDESHYSLLENTSFSKPGKYIIYRRIKDQPLSDPTQGKYSNIASLDLLVHRKPIALDSLDWTYDPIEEKYQTRYIDQSYDPDMEFSDPDKGIVDWKIRMRHNGGSWIYGVPDYLDAGFWEKELTVMDQYGVWSDVYANSFILSEVPPPQILSGQLNAKEDRFDLSSIPHTEYVTLSNLRVRYPYEVDLKYEWVYDGTSLLSGYFTPDYIGLEEKTYESYDFLIPKDFVNGNYQLKIYAIDSLNANNYDALTFTVHVETPFNLSASLPDMMIPGDNLILAETSDYVDAVDLTLYLGTLYEKTVSMVLEEGQWSYTEVPEDLLDGSYDFEFEAFIYSTPVQSQALVLSTDYVGLAIESISIEGMWDYYDGQVNIFYEPKPYEPHRFLSMEEIVMTVDTLGKPDAVRVIMSDELMAMFYTDPYGNLYAYESFMGYVVDFPLIMETSDAITFSKSYILPLADSTKNEEDLRLKPPYWMAFILKKGDQERVYYVTDIEITGNTLDHIYIQPLY